MKFDTQGLRHQQKDSKKTISNHYLKAHETQSNGSLKCFIGDRSLIKNASFLIAMNESLRLTDCLYLYPNRMHFNLNNDMNIQMMSS